MSNLITWQDSYSLGMDEIDDQHQFLFQIMNRIWHAIIQRADVGTVVSLIEELEQYTIAHFTAEETYLRMIRYPEFDAHKQAHQSFISRVAVEKKSILAGNSITLDLLHFLKDWLVNHILVVDRQYADYSERGRGAGSILGKLGLLFGWPGKKQADKEAGKPEVGNNEETMQGLDLSKAIDAHVQWKARLSGVLEGTAQENIDIGQASRDDCCTLGKWLHGPARESFGQYPEYGALRSTHANFHLCAGQVLLEFHKSGKASAQKMLQGEFMTVSSQVHLDLVELYVAVKKVPAGE